MRWRCALKRRSGTVVVAVVLAVVVVAAVEEEGEKDDDKAVSKWIDWEGRVIVEVRVWCWKPESRSRNVVCAGAKLGGAGNKRLGMFGQGLNDKVLLTLMYDETMMLLPLLAY